MISTGLHPISMLSGAVDCPGTSSVHRFRGLRDVGWVVDGKPWPTIAMIPWGETCLFSVLKNTITHIVQSNGAVWLNIGQLRSVSESIRPFRVGQWWICSVKANPGEGLSLECHSHVAQVPSVLAFLSPNKPTVEMTPALRAPSTSILIAFGFFRVP
jgi:hypothetical protein